MTRGPAETGHGWPGAAPRVGLGCMRLSTAEDRDDDVALATITAAVEAGITVFDTARAYGRGEADLGHNERLLARALRACGAAGDARVVTKGGMARPKGAWVPDGRAKAIRADCEASLVALDGLPIDLYLVHAPDPRTPWRTTLRALVRLVDEGLVRHVGVANVSRPQLDEALGHAPIAAVQVGLNPFDDSALRGGVVERCAEAGVAVIAHSPLGGPRRKRALARNHVARRCRERTRRDPRGGRARLASRRLAGARRDSRRADTRGRALRGPGGKARAARRGPLGAGRRFRRSHSASTTAISRHSPGRGRARDGHPRCQQDPCRVGVRRPRLRPPQPGRAGGSLRDLAEALDESLGAGTPAAVLDNTHLTRASRSHVLDIAARHGVRVDCVWLDIPLAQAQVNLVERLLQRFGSLPGPEELRRLSMTEPGVLAPTSQMRALRELEPPSPDEGFARVQRVPFERERSPGGATGLFVARTALRREGWRREVALAGESTGPTLLFDWSPDGRVHDLAADGARLAAEVRGPVETALCPHGGGPPICWCRPPLPGLLLEFARAHDVDAAASVLVGASPAHRTLAEALGARYLAL